MTLSDKQILRALADGHVVCRPLRVENVRGASIDLTIGEYFWRCDARPGGVFNPYDAADVARYFDGPFRAKPYADVHRKLVEEVRDLRAPTHWPLPAGYEPCARNDWKPGVSPFKSIPDDWPVIVLRPGERILAHSHEFVGIYAPGTSKLSARSSTGRVGLTVALCAGLGDPGYVNRWTWEMTNLNREAIIIPVGERMAQISFFQTGATREQYGAEELYESKYQLGADLEQIIAGWAPEQMLPRNYQDQRVEPASTSADDYERALIEVEAMLASCQVDDAKAAARSHGEGET